MPAYFVRVGYQADVVSMTARTDQFARGDAVVCRTSRGIEIGEVLAEAGIYLGNDGESAASVASILRRQTPEDQLLWGQLRTLSLSAGDACRSFLESTQSTDVLLDVEPLLDGRTLYFHFIGEPSTSTEAQVQSLAELYEQNVSQSKFARLLESGCGPGCGTAEKSRCGTSGGCAVCAVAGGCSKK